MGKKNKKERSVFKEPQLKAVVPDPVVEEEFPALGSTRVHQQPAGVLPANSSTNVPVAASMATNDVLPIQQTDPAGKSE